MMGLYLQKVYLQLQLEIGDSTAARWLIPMLEAHEWWLPTRLAPEVCERVGLAFEPLDLAYYVAIYVWLPDVRWGATAMPICVSCASASRVAPHGWTDGAPHRWLCGRRVTTLTRHYYVISRRYICHQCRCTRNVDTEAVRTLMASIGVRRARHARSLAHMWSYMCDICARARARATQRTRAQLREMTAPDLLRQAVAAGVPQVLAESAVLALQRESSGEAQ